jgi:hypothetical protein
VCKPWVKGPSWSLSLGRMFVSYLSQRSREIREEDSARRHPVYDFRSDRYLKPGRTDVWLPAEDDRVLHMRWTWGESVNYLGRGG